jgi:hypothetical protein
MIEHEVPKDSRDAKRLQVDIRITGDHIINSHNSIHQCMDKEIHIEHVSRDKNTVVNGLAQ